MLATHPMRQDDEPTRFDLISSDFVFLVSQVTRPPASDGPELAYKVHSRLCVRQDEVHIPPG